MIHKQEKYIHTTDVHNMQAADEMVPYIMELFAPSSVADVGCGLGSWLKSFQNAGVKTIAGFDGQYVNTSRLYIDAEHFTATDLEKPLHAAHRYDLALCLEVAEHLHEDAAAVLVDSLVRLSDTIIFSAAIPGQGGQHHINEQWPSWWAAHFEKHGYFFYDAFRSRFWDNQKIPWWYRQNMFLVTLPSQAGKHRLKASCSALVHPDLYLNKTGKISHYEHGDVSLHAAWKTLYRSMLRAFKSRAKQ